MFYHESISACLNTVLGNDIPVTDDLLIVRDASGRLTVCRAVIPNRAALDAALRQVLGGYAASPPSVDGILARSMLADPSAVAVERSNEGRQLNFKFADRRIVGSDWLVGPAPANIGKPLRFVFASLKGGVGRTTALTIAAANLAKQGRRVLVIDLDLEAPGVGSMLLSAEHNDGMDSRPLFGSIDYLVEDNVDGVPDERLVDFVGKSGFSGGFIDVMPAVGRLTDDAPASFIEKLSRALTESVKDGVVVPLRSKLAGMIARLESNSDYDVVLIDARAGIAEVSAAPLLTLGAFIFLFATEQEQTFSGYKYILSYMSSITDFSALSLGQDWRERLVFVQSKAPATIRQRASFRDKVYDLCSEWLYEEGEQDEVFAYAPIEEGLYVPHDSTYVRYDPAYDAFDPTVNGEQLDKEVYFGPFGGFLTKLDAILESQNGQ